ncbi:MAG: DNA polymerase III subunit delta [Bacilli bacterium]
MIYIIFGSYPYLIKKSINNIKNEILGKEADEISFVECDFSIDDINKIGDELSIIPMGYEKKIVSFNNSTFLLEKDNELEKNEKYIQMFKLIDVTDESLILIFSIESKYISTTNKFYKFVSENGQIIERIEPSNSDLTIFIKKKLASLECDIENDAIEELKRRTNSDLFMIENEFIKLSNYSSHIYIDDVRKLVSEPIDDNNFNILSFLLDGNINGALKTFRDLRIRGIEPVILISMLTTQMIFIHQVYYLSHVCFKSNDDIAKELRAKPGRIYMSLKNMNKINEKILLKELENLYNLDKSIKKGEIDRNVGFEFFLLKFGK